MSRNSRTNDNSSFHGDYIPDEDDTHTDDSGSASGKQQVDMLRDQDRFLPICNIIKIMKHTIPENGKIAKDARECIQECVSEFISFITSEAIDRSVSENRKTVNGDDLVYSFANLGFDNYAEPLAIYLRKYRESTKSDRNIVYPGSMEEDSDDFQEESNVANSSTPINNSTNNDSFFQNNPSGNFNL